MGEVVPEEIVEALRDFEWAGSCSPNRPPLDSAEWARMRLEAVYAAIHRDLRERLLDDEARNAAQDAAEDASVYTELDDEYVRLMSDAALTAALDTVLPEEVGRG